MSPKTAEFRFHGHDLTLDPSGALYVASSGLLVVSDLHFEKGSYFAGHGSPLPPYDTRHTLANLAKTIARHRPGRVICLGDSFHDAGAPGRLDEGDRQALVTLIATTDWIWVSGNHDPQPPRDLGGHVTDELSDQGLQFRHIATPGAEAGEVSGHYHPVATVNTRARTMSRRCFVTDGRRLLLPAFGAYAGGLNVLDGAISTLFVGAVQTYVVGRDRVYAVPHRNLRPPPRRLGDTHLSRP